MTELNIENELTKRRYAEYLTDVVGRAEKTVDHALTAIVKYEGFTDGRPFKAFRNDDARKFKVSLLEGKKGHAASRSARSTAHTTLNHIEQFFRWLAGQPGFKKALKDREMGYFNLSNSDRRVATSRIEKACPDVEQVRKVILSMPCSNDVQLRDRAVVATALLTAARIGALASLRLEHVRKDGLGIDQIGGEVRTKFSKTFTTLFYPVGDDIRDILLGYVRHLREVLHRTDEDALFPSTQQIAPGDRHFGRKQLGRKGWETADPIRDIFKTAFARAGMPYFTPHTLRSTITKFGASLCRNAEEMKAWSQGLGHEHINTTMSYYATLNTTERSVIMERITERQREGAGEDELMRSLMGQLQRRLSDKHC